MFIALMLQLRGKPFVFKTPMLMHNFLMTVLSLYMVVEFLRQAFVVGNYSVWGNTLDRSEKGLGVSSLYTGSRLAQFSLT